MTQHGVVLFEDAGHWQAIDDRPGGLPQRIADLLNGESALTAAARTVVDSATGLLDCDTACGRCRHVPTALLDALRAAFETADA